MPGIYDPVVLVGVVRSLMRPKSFLLDTFFPNVITATTEEVAIDIEKGNRRLAPFCSPLVEGKLVEGVGYTTNLFKPAYIKDKRAPDLLKPVRRAIGEAIGAGELTGAQREEANLALEMADQIDMIVRRMEWMAASALRAGTVTITGEGFPTTVVNFQRDAALTIALTGDARWGQTGVIPGDTIEDAVTLVMQKSGAAVTDVVFTPGAWRKFRTDPFVKDAIQSPNNTDVSIALGGGVAQGGMFKGTWGSYRLWLFNDWYTDPVDGQLKPFLPDGTVILGSAAIEGRRMHGLIKDPKFNYQPMEFAPKSWLTEDPAQRLLMMQSAPIVVPFRPDASASMMVI
jgi:hypothetical protein